MPSYLVRCIITRKVLVDDVEDEDIAIEKAPNPENCEDWDTSSVEYEADEATDEDGPLLEDDN